MFGTAGLSPAARPVQARQLSVRFTEPELARLEKAASNWGMGKSTLVQRLVVEWLDSLDQAAA